MGWPCRARTRDLDEPAGRRMEDGSVVQQGSVLLASHQPSGMPGGWVVPWFLGSSPTTREEWSEGEARAPPWA